MKTDQGYIIEFQHSYIKPGERQAREDFYKKMVWVVDGTRRLRDKDKFIDVWEKSEQLHSKVKMRRLRDYFDQSALLRDWGSSKVLVFLDFCEDVLWGLLPKTSEKRAYAFKIGRKELIAYLCPGSQGSFEELLKKLTDFLIAKENLATVQQNLQPRMVERSIHRYRRWL